MDDTETSSTTSSERIARFLRNSPSKRSVESPPKKQTPKKQPREEEESPIKPREDKKRPREEEVKKFNPSDIKDLLDAPPQITTTSKPCRACEKGYFTKKDSKLVNVIARLVKDYAFVVSPETLIHQIYLVGELERECMIKKGEGDPGEWTPDEIKTHIFDCMQNPSLMVLEQILKVKDHMRKTEKTLWKRDPETDEEVMNEKSFRIFYALQSQLKTLHSFAPERSIGFNPNINLHSKLRKAS